MMQVVTETIEAMLSTKKSLYLMSDISNNSLSVCCAEKQVDTSGIFAMVGSILTLYRDVSSVNG
jgi:hypothetical protein